MEGKAEYPIFNKEFPGVEKMNIQYSTRNFQ